MGVATRRPVLPAPTESLLESAEETGLSTDIATDISRVTDRTSHTIPDDGSPITITTGKKRSALQKLTKGGNASQTSLLIEYFEGGKDPQSGKRRPSLRVKVRPSTSRKNKAPGDAHVVVTESQGARRPSYSRRISLGTDSPSRVVDAESVSSLDSLVNTRRVRKPPIEIEVASPEESDISTTSHSPEARFIVPESDISSMPADSMLGTHQHVTMPRPTYENDYSDEENIESGALKPPSFPTDRNASNERITQKVIEKLSNKPRLESSKRQHGDKIRRRSDNRDSVPEGHQRSSRRKVSKSSENESVTTTTGSSLPSNSVLSADHPSIDQRSALSGASTTSINNPKLLRTVEDAIRRLILPELEEIKKDKKQTPHHSRYDRETVPSDISGSSFSREETTRRVSSGHRKRRSSRTSSGATPTSSRTHERHHRELDYDSPSEQNYRHNESLDSVSLEDKQRSQKHGKDRRLRDATAAALAGGALTTAALHHHESTSSIDDSERLKRRSKSKSRSSRSTSMKEEDEIFHKYDVPPMPMTSEIGTDLTRSSLLSSNTAGTATPVQREVREVIRGEPKEVSSPISQTPTRTSVNLRKGLGTHHGNLSERNLSMHNIQHPHNDFEEPDDDAASFENQDDAFMTPDNLTDEERVKQYELRNLHTQHPIRRGLSPIQSVASYTTTEPNRNSIMHQRSSGSLQSYKQHQPELKKEISIASSSPAPSTDLARSWRPQGISLENRSEIMGRHGDNKQSSKDFDPDEFYDEQHSQNEQYRDSYASSDPKLHVGQMSNFTDDSMDAPYLDKVTAGHHVAYGHGANPEYVHTPSGVESAVASLVDASVLDNSQLSYRSQGKSISQHDAESLRSAPREALFEKRGSPLKQQLSRHSIQDVKGHRQNDVVSPIQSISQSARSVRSAQSDTYGQISQASMHKVSRTSIPPTPEAEPVQSPESETTTNPSVIQGPIGGLSHGNRDHWPLNPTPPRSKPKMLSTVHDIDTVDDHLVPEALAINREHDFKTRSDPYMGNQMVPTPPGVRDEGYITGDNPPSPGYGMQSKNARMENLSPAEIHMDGQLADDPFTTKASKYMSGLSQGMSPLYDGATGKGIDRIHSKDIVALMDHVSTARYALGALTDFYSLPSEMHSAMLETRRSW